MKIKTVLLIMMFVTADSLLSAQGLRVEPGTCIKVETGTTLDISGGGDLFLESDATGDASLIDLGSVSYTGGGEANVERYITQGVWHLISPPVADAQAGMFVDAYLQYFTEGTNSYTDITSPTHPLNPMHGYALWIVAGKATTKTFTGTTNTDAQQFAITATGQRWNLAGNPYPSSIDWDLVTIPGDLNGTFYVWNPDKGANGDYETYLTGGGGGNSTSQYIASGQGFFVRSEESAPEHNLSFDNTMRTHGTQLFYKNSSPQQELVLNITGNNVTTKTSIRFLQDATPMVDRLYDSEKLFSENADIPNLYSYAADKKMAINSLPSIDAHETVNIGFVAGMDGKYTIEATHFENIPDTYPIILEDVEREIYHDLRSNTQYVFNYLAGAEKPFRVHFKNVTGMYETIAEAPAFQCLLYNGRLSVNYLGSSPFEGPAFISIYSLTGQLMLTKETNNPQTEIPFYGPAAIYIVHIRYMQAIYSIKVFNQ